MVKIRVYGIYLDVDQFKNRWKSKYWTLRKMAREYGLSVYKITNIAKALMVGKKATTRPRSRARPPRSLLLKLRSSLISNAEIAKMFGVAPITICKWAKEYGLPKRKPFGWSSVRRRKHLEAVRTNFENVCDLLAEEGCMTGVNIQKRLGITYAQLARIRRDYPDAFETFVFHLTTKGSITYRAGVVFDGLCKTPLRGKLILGLKNDGLRIVDFIFDRVKDELDLSTQGRRTALFKGYKKHIGHDRARLLMHRLRQHHNWRW